LLLLLLLLLPGLVEAWAGGASWQEIMADTSIDDGDMARLLARTADMLKQVRLSTIRSCSMHQMRVCEVKLLACVFCVIDGGMARLLARTADMLKQVWCSSTACAGHLERMHVCVAFRAYVVWCS
jgi:hypothetical protein